jgi:DNA-binding transcriptional MerR regulator
MVDKPRVDILTAGMKHVPPRKRQGVAVTLSPSELARLAGVSTDTLRHYERKGVLAPAPRSSSGYRRYPPAAVDRVRLIQRALMIGFSLDELSRVLAERQRGRSPCRSVRELVAERLSQLEKRLQELATLREDLVDLLREWDLRLSHTPVGTQARLLDALEGRLHGEGQPGSTGWQRRRAVPAVRVRDR